MKKTLLFTMAFSALIFIGCDESSNSGRYSTDYQSAKGQLEDQESANPTDFLAGDLTYRRTLLNKWVLEGSIKSSATVATYKDITIEVLYKSKTNSVVGSETFTLYEYLKPGRSIDYSFRSNSYRNAVSVSWKIIGAKPSY